MPNLTVEQRLAAMEAENAKLRADNAAKQTDLDKAKAALAKKSAGGVLDWYIANDGQTAGEPDADEVKRLGKGSKEAIAYSKGFCKGSISVRGINKQFPISLYRSQWLRFLDGVTPDDDAKAPFINRFVAYLLSDECSKHYAVSAADARHAD